MTLSSLSVFEPLLRINVVNVSDHLQSEVDDAHDVFL